MKNKKYLWIGAALLVAVIIGFNAWRLSRSYQLYVSWSTLTAEETIHLKLIQRDSPDVVLHETERPAKEGWLVRVDKKIPVEKLAVLLETPEGWADCPVELETKTAGRPTMRLRAGMTTIWADNLGGGKTRATCGSYAFPIEANSKSSFRFPTPLEKAVPFMLGEQQIGEIPPLKRKDRFLLDDGYLLDCTGKNRYSYENIAYGGSLRIAGRPGFSSGKSTLESKFLHPLNGPHVDYFLERAPEKITVKTYTGVTEDQLRIMIVRE